MQPVYELAPVIGAIISAHCPNTGAEQAFMRACIREQWDEATAMVEGMLAEPWHLRGYQEGQLREFLELVPVPLRNSGDETKTTADVHQATF
jgi:hypothetical protein